MENFAKIARFVTNIESCFDLEKEEKKKSKKELKANERLNKKLMYNKLKSTGILTSSEHLHDKEIVNNSETFSEEIDNLFLMK